MRSLNISCNLFEKEEKKYYLDLMFAHIVIKRNYES